MKLINRSELDLCTNNVQLNDKKKQTKCVLLDGRGNDKQNKTNKKKTNDLMVFLRECKWNCCSALTQFFIIIFEVREWEKKAPIRYNFTKPSSQYVLFFSTSSFSILSLYMYILFLSFFSWLWCFAFFSYDAIAHTHITRVYYCCWAFFVHFLQTIHKHILYI